MERITETGAVFETDHRAFSAMQHHRHEFPFVTIVLRGAYVEVQDAAPEICSSGAIVLHTAGEEHADRFASDTFCLNVELPQGRDEKPLRGNVRLDMPIVRDSVASVVRSFYRHTNELPDAVSNLQSNLLDLLPDSLDDRPPWLSHVIEHFPWAQPIPLREAAALGGVHETHFSRAFRRYVGMTANEYRARTRVHLASKLLLTTTASLACVALSAGFSDQSHLTRAFTQRLGLSPADYRRTFTR